MVEKWDPEPIKQLLNHSLVQIDQSTLAHLSVARMYALNRYEARDAALPFFAWVGFLHASVQRHSIKYWMGALLFATCLFYGVTYWQQAMDNDTSDVDIAILTGDLPIQSYLN